MNRRLMLAMMAVCGMTVASCGTTAESGSANNQAAQTAADDFVLTVEWTSMWVEEIDGCALELANTIEDGPFSDGKSIDLKDEAGVLLSRATVRHIGMISDSECAMAAVFRDVPQGHKNYVVHSSIGGTWTFLASEVESGKVSVDYFETAGQS